MKAVKVWVYRDIDDRCGRVFHSTEKPKVYEDHNGKIVDTGMAEVGWIDNAAKNYDLKPGEMIQVELKPISKKMKIPIGWIKD